VGRGDDAEVGSGPAPAPVASFDAIAGAEPGMTDGGAARIALFDAEQIGTARAGVPVARLGEPGARRPGPRPPGRGSAGATEVRREEERASAPEVERTSSGSGTRRGAGQVRGRAGRRPDRDRAPQPDPPPGAATESDVAAAVDPLSVARSICLGLLTERARTRHELAVALRRKDVPDDAVQAVLERFGEVGLIDDASFAEQWVHSRHTGRGLGRRALAMELRRKGVADELAGAALENLDPAAEELRARQLVERKLRSLSIEGPEQRAAAARRLAGMLGRKGYPAGVAYRVVRAALAAHGADADELGPDDGLDPDHGIDPDASG
jgi:regulatory protein